MYWCSECEDLPFRLICEASEVLLPSSVNSPKDATDHAPLPGALQKLTKVKATDKLSIPLKLDMASILAMAGAQPLQIGTYQDAQYELMSILIHKGPSASHGHYGMLIPRLLNRASLSVSGSSICQSTLRCALLICPRDGNAEAHLTPLNSISCMSLPCYHPYQHWPCASFLERGRSPMVAVQWHMCGMRKPRSGGGAMMRL